MESNLPATQNNNAVVTPDDINDNSDGSAQQVVMCYVKTETRQDKIRLLNALENASDKINDHVNQVLEVTGIYAETHFSKKKNKEVSRTLVMTADGKTYATGSFVFMNSLKRITDIVGSPLEEKLKIKIVNREMENGKALLAQIVE